MRSPRPRVALRVPLLSGLVMDLLHRRLQRAPTYLAQVAVVVRHELLAVAGAVDADARPPQIVVLCVPKTLSELMTCWNRLSWRNDRIALFRSGHPGLAIQVEVAA